MDYSTTGYAASPQGVRSRVKRWRWRASAVGAALALVATACGGASSGRAEAAVLTDSGGGSTIVIGEDVGLSGPTSFLGTVDVPGAVAYVKMINAKGGVLGHKFKLVEENNQSEPSLAAALIRKLVQQDHAGFIFGPEETGEALAAIPVANQLQVLDLGWWSGWPLAGIPSSYFDISPAAATSWSFPGILDASVTSTQDCVSTGLQAVHANKVAVLTDSVPFGQEFLPDANLFSKKYGYQVVGSQVFTSGATDVTAQVLNILKDKPNFLLLGTVPGTDTVTAIKAIRAQDPTIPICFDGGGIASSFVAAVGGPSVLHNVFTIGYPQDYANSLPAGTPDRAQTITDSNEYKAALKAAGYATADDVTNDEEGWETMEELVAAIETAKSIEPAKVKAALQHQSIDTLGTVWDRTPQDYGHYQSAVYPLVTYTASGGYAVVK
jgi:ABC-type branched-subunit amino acid transport system substrate-binding protein